MKCTCRQCGKEFELEASEIRFYKSKNLELPKRCKECRLENRQKMNAVRTVEKNHKSAQKKEYGNAGGYSTAKQKRGSRLDWPKTSEREAQAANRMGVFYKAAILLIIVLFAAFAWIQAKDHSLQSDPASAPIQDADLSALKEDFVRTQAKDHSLPGNPAYEIAQDADSSALKEEQMGQPADRLSFRNETLRNEHYEKHGIEMGFASAEEYEEAAAGVAENPQSLHKWEAEDGDDVYYLESTNEIVIVSTDGFIRTYFYPEDGIEYYNKQ